MMLLSEPMKAYLPFLKLDPKVGSNIPPHVNSQSIFDLACY